MTSKLSFSSPLVEKLALLVQANPVLYNTLDANYKNTTFKDNIWKEISLEIEESVDDIKQIWENIKDSYSRIITRKPETGAPINLKKNWTLVHRLKFLDQNIECDQNVTSNTAITEKHDPCTFHKEEGLDYVSNKSEEGPTKTIIKNRRISESDQIEKNVLGNLQTENKQFSIEEVNELDDMDMFFQSLSLKSKQFPSAGRIEMKMKICTVMNELQEKYLVRSRTPPLRPQQRQPIYLNFFTNTHIPSEQNEFSSSSSIQSCTSKLPSLDSYSEFSNSESNDDLNSSI